MCGIAGIINIEQPPTLFQIEAMIDNIVYRGPDGAGQICFEEDGIALGHRRLSILDLSEAGLQPMASEDGRYWLVFNGEIYNYLEIREELEAEGCKFNSNSDTEVLLKSYELWGSECLQRFMGMYAFAIWDRYKRKLFSARDRLGIKPFYYCITSQGILFASEIKSILAIQTLSLEVDFSLIDSYMDFGYVPGENTLHRGIKRLLPGYMLTWHANKVVTSKYWDFSFDVISKDNIFTYADQVKQLLQNSIDLHLRSDVPLGVFLSGGLDSSAVVACLSPSVSHGLNTFSVAYDYGSNYDETPYARQVAAAFLTNHHEIRITPRQFLDFIPDYIWHMDEPVTEAAAISLYYVAKLAREHVVVCLSGEGSDELFAGYDFYTYNLMLEKAQQVFGIGFFKGLKKLIPKMRRFEKFQKYLDLASYPLKHRYHGVSSYDSLKKLALYSSDYIEKSNRINTNLLEFIEEIFVRSKCWDPLSRMLYFDTKTWLVDDLLIKADRMSMAASIELRVPFLDHRLVEYAASVPSQHKIFRGNTKFVLKQAFKEKLPISILKRQKMGFPTPLEILFRGELFDYAYQTLLSQQAVNRGYFDRKSVERLLSEHRRGVAANHREIWQLVVLEEWHRRFGY